MTSKVRFISVAGIDGIEVEHALIDHADGSYTSMTKEHYDKLQAEQSTPLTHIPTEPVV
jgi:hypothetical protein